MVLPLLLFILANDANNHGGEFDCQLWKQRKQQQQTSHHCCDQTCSKTNPGKLENQVSDALWGLDPDNLNQEHLQAPKAVPDLALRESQVADLLCTKSWKVQLAATCIAMFWKTQKEIFGKDWWLLLLTQTGVGAHMPDQVHLLHTGVKAKATSEKNDVVTVTNGTRLQFNAWDCR